MFKSFLGLPRLQKRLVSVAVDAVALSFALWASFAQRCDQSLWVPNQGQLLGSAPPAVSPLGSSVRLGLYREVVRYMTDRAFWTICIGVVAAARVLIIHGSSPRCRVPV